MILYRWRFTNWLMAKPWRWNYAAIWRAHERPWPNPLVHAWRTVTFPHVHHRDEP